MTRIDVSPIEKRVRAEVIKRYMARNNLGEAVCFSCGNATAKLKQAGVNLLAIAPDGDLESHRWFTQEEIARLFPNLFDATSGHLPIHLMREIADELRVNLTFDTGTRYIIPSGSGETVVCLKMAFPTVDFYPEYNDNYPATEYSPHAPLNRLVKAMFGEKVKHIRK